MPKFAANLTMMFNEVPFLDRFARAAAAGFGAVEFLFPYAFPAEEIKARLDANRLTLVLCNLPAGDWDAGERGIACIPGREAEFRDGVANAIVYAKTLGVTHINCLAGKTPTDADAAAVHRTLISNLRLAAAALGDAGKQLLVEPINDRDVPGFHITRTAQALAVIDEVGGEHVRLQYDVYHAQRMEGELANTLQAYLSRIAHVQIADTPGRHEPGTGEINFGFLFSHLDRIGYAGYVGCEYKPAGVTETGLDWMRRFPSA